MGSFAWNVKASIGDNQLAPPKWFAILETQTDSLTVAVVVGSAGGACNSRRSQLPVFTVTYEGQPGHGHSGKIDSPSSTCQAKLMSLVPGKAGTLFVHKLGILQVAMVFVSSIHWQDGSVFPSQTITVPYHNHNHTTTYLSHTKTVEHVEFKAWVMWRHVAVAQHAFAQRKMRALNTFNLHCALELEYIGK